MKVLLIWPPLTTGNRYQRLFGHFYKTEPLALEYIASGVRDLCDVRLLDMRLENEFDGLQEALETFNPDVVGSTAFTININDCRRIFRQVKAFDERILTVIGGHHATVAPDDLLDGHIDLVVIGEGVFTFKEIVETFQRGDDFGEIKGIAIREGDTLHKTAPRSYPKPSDLPLPDRSINSHLRHNFRSPMFMTSEPVALLRSTDGCAYRCHFCAGWQATQGKLYALEPELVVQELLTTKEENIVWADNDFFVHRDRSLELAALIKEAGIKKNHVITVRTDSICRSPELVERWKDVGLVEVMLGLESYRDEDLEKMNKHTSVLTNNEAVRILKQNEVAVCTDFMVDPEYEEDNFKRLADYVRGLEVEVPFFTVMTPLPGSALFKATRHKHILHNWDFFDCGHAIVPTKLELKQFYAETASLYVQEWFSSAGPYQKILGEIPQEEAEQMLQVVADLENGLQKMYEDHLAGDDAVLADVASYG